MVRCIDYLSIHIHIALADIQLDMKVINQRSKILTKLFAFISQVHPFVPSSTRDDCDVRVQRFFRVLFDTLMISAREPI